MTRSRVLLLNTDFERGGVPGVIKELALRLRARGHDVSAACLADDGPVGAEMRASGVPVTALGAKGVLDLKVLLRLRELVGGRFDVVLSSLVHANVAAAWTARQSPGVRWLQAIHTTQPRPRWHWLAQRWAARYARQIVTPSQSIADCAARRSGIAPQKMIVIPSGIDAARFASLNPVSLEQVPAAIGFVGRLDPVKRIPDLIAAAALLQGRVHLHLIGEGEERPRLERLIAAKGLRQQVTLHGLLGSAEEAFREIGLLVLCSEAEGLPMVLLEALAAGIPIVATDAPGIRDAVQHEETALLCPVGNPPALAAAISRMLDAPVLRERLRAAGRQRARQHYDWTQIIPQYEALLFEG